MAKTECLKYNDLQERFTCRVQTGQQHYAEPICYLIYSNLLNEYQNK